MERVTALDVFYGEELIGTVFDTEPLSFEYAPAWLGRQQPAGPFPLSSIALKPGRLPTGRFERRANAVRATALADGASFMLPCSQKALAPSEVRQTTDRKPGSVPACEALWRVWRMWRLGLHMHQDHGGQLLGV